MIAFPPITSSGEPPLDGPHLRCTTILHPPSIVSHLPGLILDLGLNVMVGRDGLGEDESSDVKVTLIDRLGFLQFHSRLTGLSYPGYC